MTVIELIEKLQKCPRDYDVYRYNSLGSPEELISVEIYPNEEEVWL